MKIAHFSDVHGHISCLAQILGDVEALISTGDFFPNSTRGEREIEVAFQTEWFNRNKTEIFRLFAGRPIACVDGNHDYVSLGTLLVEAGYPGIVVNVNSDSVQDFLGFKVAGFREIPWIAGEWNGESTGPQMHSMADTALQTGCSLLLTHTPPKGILSGDYGCPSLTSLLTYSPHSVRFHFFGHCHDEHGTVEEMDILFSNAATAINVVDLV
jgi:Icc-related predicted phosphoesterase